MTDFRSILDAVSSVATGKRRRRRLGVRYPAAYALQYQRDLSRYTKSLRVFVERWVNDDLKAEMEHLVLERGDARLDSSDSLRDALERLEAVLLYAFMPQAMRNLAKKHARSVVESSKRQWTRAMQTIRKETPFIDERPLEEILTTFVTENERLIDAIPRKYHADVMRIVTAGVLAQKDFDAIAREIEAAYPDKAAGNLSVNQMGVLAGALSMELHSQASLDSYVWCDNRDERVRGNPMGRYPNARYSHWARNGKVFRWSNPPPDGHPGFPLHCRCWPAINEEEARGDQKQMAQEGQAYDEVALT